ncbi:response regulator transcription factor [Actinophytocola sp.]|uniref:response regulator transcription factor n=1 Tax=Actinophytocola sp. TaxID=1872138 RepID=UPI00389B177E
MAGLALVTDDRAVPVRVEAGDPLLQAGVENCLHGFADLAVLGTPAPGSVALVVADRLDDAALHAVATARRADRPVLLVATVLDGADGMRAFRAGVGGVLRRKDASPERLRAALLAVAGGYGTVPPDLLDIALTTALATARTTALIAPAGPVLDEREKAVLSLLADGHETAEVARRLAYSVRTVTSVVHDITSRLRLRNRAHAVAFALREGLI